MTTTDEVYDGIVTMEAGPRCCEGYGATVIANTARVAAACLPLAFALGQGSGDELHMGNGIKIGDARADRCAVWVRLTAIARADQTGVSFPTRKAHTPQLPTATNLSQMAGAVPGAGGDVRVRYWPDGAPSEERSTAWTPVTAATNHAHTFTLSGLNAGARYVILSEGKPSGSDRSSCFVEGQVQLPYRPSDHAAVSFCVICGQDYHRRDDDDRGHLIYGVMQNSAPDFVANVGDAVYYDKPKPWADTAELARFKWNRFYGLPLQRDFHAKVGAYFVKDDHDTLKNDCWPGQRYGELTWARGLELYREQLPLLAGEPYRRVRWGALLEVWFLEGREFRSPNRAADGPAKTILGATQWRWLEQTLAASDATFKVVVSATPIVGPDRKNKNDNHANRGFQHEGDRLRRLLAEQGVHVVCGDRHWQYASRDPVTGLREWCCGPTTNQHSGGFSMKQRSEQHDFLRIRGGFLHVSVAPAGGSPSLTIRHVGTDGETYHEDTLRPRAPR